MACLYVRGSAPSKQVVTEAVGRLEGGGGGGKSGN
jgi:hypothetical protein